MKTEVPDGSTPLLSFSQERENVVTALTQAEDKRKTALSASICLSFSAGFAAFQSSLFDVAGIGSYVAAIIFAAPCWKLSNWMWHSLAICSLAPEIASRYGQKTIRNAWEFWDFESWITAQFNNQEQQLTSWQSEGNYRNIAYRLREVSVQPARRTRPSSPPRYYLMAEISVPASFSGRIEIRLRNSVTDPFISFIKQMLGDDSRIYTGDQHFDEIFEIYGENCPDYQSLLTPALRKALLTIAQYGVRQRFSARFEKGWFYLDFPIETPIFKNASLLQPMPQLMDAIQQLWWDLTMPQRLIDGLTGNYEGPLL
ncbi:DUF3137 domain-containing protein [Bacillus subtilis]|uniref:DUF3137 domain-containing protein n=1 Tax=Pseudochrobactrum asaccharolyticum TaxID=354351 RepID=UPI001F47AC88|nr:DUF3137 domain-containing protein [Pseudochrobactrum asaccharolyticum]MCF7646467.1 DUF3137 domain-containing protein [Pseudochrobactrum asaccharolyticum]MCF7672249.1 DUF3137 domain-containing protein [Bacillus subtilis]